MFCGIASRAAAEVLDSCEGVRGLANVISRRSIDNILMRRIGGWIGGHCGWRGWDVAGRRGAWMPLEGVGVPSTVQELEVMSENGSANLLEGLWGVKAQKPDQQQAEHASHAAPAQSASRT